MLSNRVEVAKVFLPVIVALIGGPVLIWRALTAHWAAQAAQRQADTGREAHFTGLFTKAVEQIGATREATKLAPRDWAGTTLVPQTTITTTEPNLEVRLGAIYALERIAQDSERDHWPIMEVLCAYIRNPQNSGFAVIRPDDAFPPTGPEESGSEAWMNWLNRLRGPRVDVQAALTVLARRAVGRVQYELTREALLDFTSANLQYGNFQKGRFAGARFDEAHLDRASFYLADLRRASFIQARLEQSVLMDAELDLVDFSGAAMCQARFRKTSAKSTKFNAAHLESAIFREVKFFRPEFISANLRGARFVDSLFEDASFVDADLRGSQFWRVILRGLDFTAAKLDSCSFVETVFDGVNFEGAVLSGTEFFGADLSSAKRLSTEQLAVAKGTPSTILPQGVERPDSWTGSAPQR